MCRHEPVPLLWVLVLPGRRPLRPAACCVDGDRAYIASTVQARNQSSSRAGPEGVNTFRAFCVRRVCFTFRSFYDHQAIRSPRRAPRVGRAAVARRRPAADQRPVGRDRPRSTTARSRSRSASRSPAPAPTSKGSFFNGDDKTTSTSGSFENGKLSLNFDELRHEARRNAERRPARRRSIRAARAARRTRLRPSASRRWRAGDAKIPSIAGLWNVQVGQELEGRSGVAAHRSAVRRRSIGGHPADRRRHRHADRHLSRRQVRSQSFFGRAAAASRADAGRRRHAGRRAEQRQAADGGARRAGDREGAAAAERSVALHQRQGSDRAVPLQLPRSRRQDGVEHRSRASRAKSSSSPSAAAGARTVTTKRRSSSSCTRNTRSRGSRSSSCRSKKKRRSRIRFA